MNLAEFQFTLSNLITPIVVLLVTLGGGKVVLNVTAAIAAMFVFKAKGYQMHQVVKINGSVGTITKIGLLSTHFLMLNGPDSLEFLCVSNTRLDFMEVRSLVRKHKPLHGRASTTPAKESLNANP